MGGRAVALRLPDPCLVVLIGTSGAGKTTWADRHFPGRVVSTDRLRALVGQHQDDQRAGADAFDVLDLVVDRRLKRRLLTVIDSLALNTKRRQSYIATARARGVPVHAVVFDTPADICRKRLRESGRPISPSIVKGQVAELDAIRESISGEGFDGVHAPEEIVEVVAPEYFGAPAAAARQREEPLTMNFGLQIPNFTWTGGPAELGPRLADMARAADDAGFESIWVMDHFLQIPMVGREWQEMLDSYTALAFMAGITSRARLGALVTGVTYRNVAHLGKIIATLDVLSGGRAICGIGAAWFEREHKAYGWEFPPLKERYALLEDALQLLPLLWGKGSPSFEGKVISVPEAMCYPRPLQEKVPIMIGGSGEKKTLRLVAQYADACNLFGDADTVRHKIEVLHRHCADVGRDPSEIQITVLSQAPVDKAVEDHIGRFRPYADAGVDTVIVNMPGLDDATPITRFADVIAAFSGPA